MQFYVSTFDAVLIQKKTCLRKKINHLINCSSHRKFNTDYIKVFPGTEPIIRKLENQKSSTSFWMKPICLAGHLGYHLKTPSCLQIHLGPESEIFTKFLPSRVQVQFLTQLK